MERHEIIEAMTELKLYTACAPASTRSPARGSPRDEIYTRLVASLIPRRAYTSSRPGRSAIASAGPSSRDLLKDLDTFVFARAGRPGPTARTRHRCFPRRQAGIFIGGTGTGKDPSPPLASLPGHPHPRQGRFFQPGRSLVHNRSSRKRPPAAAVTCAENLLRYDLIVIDELGYLPFNGQPAGQFFVPPDQQALRE